MNEILFWAAVLALTMLIPMPTEIEILRHFGLWRDRR